MFSSPTARRMADPLERPAGGFLHGGKEDAAAFLTALKECLQRVDTGHIDGGRIVQVHDEHLGRRLHRVQRGLEPVGHPEEQRPVDGENLHAVRHGFLIGQGNVVRGGLFLFAGNASVDAVSSLMRRLNSREASMTPVYTATVRSKITVSAKVRIITDQSDFGPWKICRTVRRSLMS